MVYDMVVIGGGPGGYVAAIRAAQLGAKVCIIEKDKLGGTCLNRGCIPTKALYRNAEILNTLRKIDEFGISVDSYKVDFNKIQSRKQSIVDQLVSGIEQLLKANHVKIIRGSACIKDKKTISAVLDDGSKIDIKGENIIIAAGSKPAVPPIHGVYTDGIYTSDDLLDFHDIPKSLAIIGGGVIGMEFACIFNAFGTKVTVIEYMPNILMQFDSDIVKRLTPSLRKRGIDINTGTSVTDIKKTCTGFTVTCEVKNITADIKTEKVLLSTGRVPAVNGLNLEGTGIEFDRKGIKVDSNYETSVRGIYAVGDVNGKVMLAHAASFQGIRAAETAAGLFKNTEESIVPACIFTFPEIASAGISEDDAKKRNIEYKVSKFMFGANGKALAIGEGEGFVKVIASCDVSGSTGEDIIVGVHIMGPHASDLIHEGALAVNNKMEIRNIINTIHAHPTLSEAFSEAVAGINGEAIHMMPSLKR